MTRLVVVVHTFNREVVVARTLSGNGRTGTHADTTAGCHAGVQQRQVDHTAAGGSQWRIRHLRRRERIFDLCRRRVYRRSRSLTSTVVVELVGVAMTFAVTVWLSCTSTSAIVPANPPPEAFTE